MKAPVRACCGVLSLVASAHAFAAPQGPAGPDELRPKLEAHEADEQSLPESSVPTPHAPWSGQTARTVAPGDWEIGVFAPLRYGLTERVELSTHALANLLMPNLTAKVLWRASEHLVLSSEHTLAYPTPLIETLSRAGTGGLWAEETVTPTIVAFHSHVLATWLPEGLPRAPSTEDRRHALTARAGVRAAASFGRANLTTADLWYLYERTAHWVNGATLDATLAAEGPIAGPFDYFADVTLFVLLGGEYEDGSPVWNHSAGLAWRAGSSVRVEAGWWLSAGDFPGPDDWQLLPRFDVAFRW